MSGCDQSGAIHRVGVFVDCENVSIDCVLPVLHELRSLKRQGTLKLERFTLYSREGQPSSLWDWNKLIATDSGHPLFKRIELRAIEPLTIKNTVDVVMSLDMLANARALQLDSVIICSSDGDYLSPVDLIRVQGCDACWIVDAQHLEKLQHRYNAQSIHRGGAGQSSGSIRWSGFVQGAFRSAVLRSRHELMDKLVMSMLGSIGGSIQIQTIQEAWDLQIRRPFGRPWPSLAGQLQHSSEKSGLWRFTRTGVALIGTDSAVVPAARTTATQPKAEPGKTERDAPQRRATVRQIIEAIDVELNRGRPESPWVYWDHVLEELRRNGLQPKNCLKRLVKSPLAKDFSVERQPRPRVRRRGLPSEADSALSRGATGPRGRANGSRAQSGARRSARPKASKAGFWRRLSGLLPFRFG